MQDVEDKLKVGKGQVITRRQLEKWFPDDDIVTVPEEVLPPDLAEDARRILTSIGIPGSFMEVLDVDVRLPERIQTIGDVYHGDGESAPRGTEELLLLGGAGQSLLTLDRASGAVIAVHEDYGSRPMAASLESFVRLLAVASEEVRRRRWGRAGGDSLGERLLSKVLKRLRRDDPLASPAAEAAWADFLAGIAANAS